MGRLMGPGWTRCVPHLLGSWTWHCAVSATFHWRPDCSERSAPSFQAGYSEHRPQPRDLATWSHRLAASTPRNKQNNCISFSPQGSILGGQSHSASLAHPGRHSICFLSIHVCFLNSSDYISLSTGQFSFVIFVSFKVEAGNLRVAWLNCSRHQICLW